ncbi:MAG: TIGR02099 family protein [Tatlockia sp.]|nr:TIGR02099 family protein [Tatlockia sp.]
MRKRKDIENNAQNNDIVSALSLLRPHALTKFLKRCWVILAFFIITAALISCLFRALTPWAKQYKTEVEQQLSIAFGQKVTINAMETGWYWFEPVVKLNQISISDGKQVAVKLTNLLIGIKVFSSLWHWQIQPGILLIEDLHLGIHQEKGTWQIDGLDDHHNQKLDWNPVNYQPILAWILGQQKIIIKNLSADIFMQNGTHIPINELNLKISNRSGLYHIKGKGSLAQTTATHFQLLADLALNPYALDETNGQVYFAVQHILPVQWAGFVPLIRFQPKDGQGDLQFWADIAQGQFTLVQSKLNFHHVAWLDTQTNKDQLIQAIKANLAWKPTNTGWELSADQVHLALDDTPWPENSFLIRFSKDSQAYFVFVKNILLGPLLKSSLSLPENLRAYQSAKLQGNLYDTQLQFKPSGMDYFLTRFSNLGWKEFGSIPGLQNLSGAVQWQPQKGQLELTGNQIEINLQKQRSIKLSALDAAFNWQSESDGLKLNIERFLINHPNLILSAKGIIDKISNESSGNINLKAEFSGNNSQFFLPFIPGKHLKPKFEAWLKKDLKRIKELSGELVVNGAIDNFPFDSQPGTFEINTHLKGVDFAFNRNWPLVKDVDAYLHINKRKLDADIVHSNLQGIIGYNSNVQIDDIGHDKEILLFRTKTDAKAAKILNLLNNSPLNKKISTLAMLKMKGLVSVDLKLEAPLYPENDKILTLGLINFQNNEVSVHHSVTNVDLTKVNGYMQFNQDGIENSQLNANIHGFPATIFIKSVQVPHPYMELKVNGKAKAEELNQKFSTPFSELLHGSMAIESTLQLTDEPKGFSHLHLQTTLEGLDVDLPSPYGKTAETQVPLILDVDFNSEKTVKMRANYDNHLSSDLTFSSSKGSLQLKKGDIYLGSSNKAKPSPKGLGISGSMETFDLEQWLALKTKMPEIKEKNPLLEAINRIDVKFLQARIWKENFKELILKADKTTANDWSIQLKEADLGAELRYQPNTNTLSGGFDKLHLRNTLLSDKKTATELKPKDIPNLDLNIASLQVGDLDLGELIIKTKSTAKEWKLENCQIKSPSYLINLKGDWSQNGKQNSTNIQAEMQINDLANGLKRWKINPAVEAKKGEIEFQGGWTGSIVDFQLSKVKGQVKIDLKNGRITNLSPETEEKLGLGKLLSILSLQTLPRRLKLDFSDLSKTGYSFDKFKGSFDLDKGVMLTQDSYIDGPVAYASMKGNLDMARQHFNLDLKIEPHITSSLPIVATIAGGPIVGFATLVASKIINHSMNNFSGYTYKVTGPWKQPVIKQVSAKQRIPLRG